MAKKEKKKQTFSFKDTQQEALNLYPIRLILLFAFSVLVMMTPYYRGLYFDYELMVFQAIAAVIFILLVLYLYASKIGFEVKYKLEYILLLFMVAYIVPFFFAANRRLAIGEFLKYAFYFAIFAMAIRLATGRFEKLTILNALFISTIGVAFFGYQAAVGLIPETARPLGMAMNGLWAGNMINSTLQYHNTAGTVLAFGFIIGLLLGLYTENKFLRAFYFAASSFVLTAFFFTYSRGSYVTLPIALLVFFILLPREKRISFVFNLAIIGAIVLAFLNKVGAQLNPNGKEKLWLILLMQFAVVWAAAYAFSFVEKRLYVLKNEVYIISALTIAALGIIGFIIALNMHLIPTSIVDKIKSISFKDRNFVERLVFYKDGLKIFLKSPIFGYGGGTWVSLYFMYQSYLYFTTQSHNYFLQVLLDTGLFGFAILMVFLYTLFSTALRAWLKKDKDKNILIAGIIGGAVQLYLHSILDFDFSLASVQVLLFASLGVLIAIVQEVLQKSKEDGKLIVQRKTKVLSPALLVFYLFVMIISINFRIGNYNANIGQQALQMNNLTAAYSFLSKAVEYDSLSSSALSDYATVLYKIGDQNKDANLIAKANSYFKQAITNDRFNAKIRFKYAVYLLSHGAIDEGLRQIEEGIKLQPLQPNNYEVKADAYAKVGDYYLGKGDKEKARKYYEVVLKIPQEIERVKRERERMPEVIKQDPNSHKFGITDRTLQIVNEVKKKI
ncbi:O-antigen ligase family protein [Caldicellulosiruptor sp. F32]|uniref:O-antigen ligase family protein n=1 Tax=Caldicellulosiruptor sp. F32 TaxID=1214564 RepID=UPI0003A66FEB|nr:O-antigen ligase family protein [Caldicellulosiruptor sp. F32]